MSLIQASNLSFRYGANLVLNNLNFAINKAEHVALIGENGSGKSTLVKLILGLLKGHTGELKVLGDDIVNLQKKHVLGYLPQSGAAQIQDKIPFLVKELVWAANITSKSSSEIDAIMSQTSIRSFKNKLYSELSGGQKQRVLLARALLNSPEILILDEPTTGIDKESRLNLFEFLKDLSRNQKITIIQVTHDIDRIKKLVDRVLCIQKSEIFEHTQGLEHVHN